MKIGVKVSALACATILAVSVITAGCGTAATTTTTVLPTTTAAPVTTTSLATTTSAAATSSTSAPAVGGIPTKEVQAYIDAITAFGEAFATSPDTSFLSITDPAAATADDLQKADAASAFAHKLLTQLQAITPPAVAATLHQQLVTLYQGEVKNLDDFIAALKAKDAAAMTTAHAALLQDADKFAPLLTQLTSASGITGVK